MPFVRKDDDMLVSPMKHFPLPSMHATRSDVMLNTCVSRSSKGGRIIIISLGAGAGTLVHLRIFPVDAYSHAPVAKRFFKLPSSSNLFSSKKIM